jgi:hypothetical protein
MDTLGRQRDRLIQRIISQEIQDYFQGKRRKRSCAWCGKKFKPKNPWHFFHQSDCRKMWYRGQFRPRD